MKIHIRGAHIIDPSQGWDGPGELLIADGAIAAIGATVDGAGAEVLDAGGLHLLPGLVDMHVHLREPGQEYKEDIASGTRAAVAGGVTSVAAMPNTAPVNDNAEVTRYILEKAAAKGVCRVYPVGAITKGLKGEDLAAIGELADAGCVAVTDDGMPVTSAMMMRRAMEYASTFGLPVISHCEEPSLAAHGGINEGETSTRLGLAAIPSEAEEIMVIRDILLARRTGAKLHLAHLSTAGSVEFLRWARAQGIAVTGETAPHYFTLIDEDVASFDTHFKMNPPLRGRGDREAIRAALADGTLDAIATDHAPHAPDEKEVEFPAAPNGIIGMETSLGAALALHFDHGVPLARLVAQLAANPARILGIPGGTLAVGGPADVALVDLGATWTVDPARFWSKSRNCPFAGRSFQGKVVTTMVGGQLVYRDGEVTADRLTPR